MYGNYYPNAALEAVNYASVILAVMIYGLILGKFLRAGRKSASAAAAVVGTGA